MANNILRKDNGGKAAPVAPVKNTMNFARHQVKFNFKKIIPALALVVIAGLLFLKFGIVDQLQKKTDAMNLLASKQEQLSSMAGKLAEYDKLAAEYGRYSYGWMSENEISLVNRLDVMDLIEEKIAKLATIENFAINSNVLSLNIRGITLTQASGIVEDLETSELVSRATVYSASAEAGREASIFMSIVLTKGAE